MHFLLSCKLVHECKIILHLDTLSNPYNYHLCQKRHNEWVHKKQHRQTSWSLPNQPVRGAGSRMQLKRRSCGRSWKWEKSKIWSPQWAAKICTRHWKRVRRENHLDESKLAEVCLKLKDWLFIIYWSYNSIIFWLIKINYIW